MCQYFKSSKWIWISERDGVDEYAEFSCRFDARKAGAVCRVSCDGDYTLLINGAYVASNQYGDYEHYKIFDEIDISGYLREGANDLFLLVWHFGADSQRYQKAKAGVILEEQLALAVQMIKDNQQAIDIMVDVLMDKNHLKEKEIDEIFSANTQKA